MKEIGLVDGYFFLTGQKSWREKESETQNFEGKCSSS